MAGVVFPQPQSRLVSQSVCCATAIVSSSSSSTHAEDCGTKTEKAPKAAGEIDRASIPTPLESVQFTWNWDILKAQVCNSKSKSLASFWSFFFYLKNKHFI